MQAERASRGTAAPSERPKWELVLIPLALMLAHFLPDLKGMLKARAERTDVRVLRTLPPGVVLQQQTEVGAEQRAAIGQKLGGQIERLVSQTVAIHGRSLQVNVLDAAAEADARELERSLLKLKPAPFVVRQGTRVVEYVGRGVDEALARKASWELGFVPKPRRVRYRVEAELATIDRADYANCNPIFEWFLAARALPGGDTDAARRSKLDELTRGFAFGRLLELRLAALDADATSERGGGEASGRKFAPAPRRESSSAATTRYEFEELEERAGIPFVRVTLEVAVDDSGRTSGELGDRSEWLRATEHWPAGDASVVELARRITEGARSDDERVAALLRWLKPGSNLKYAGATGSRWGVTRVIAQKFGRCWDFSDVFVTLARAAGVPARQTAGWLYGTSGHVWAEYWSEGNGWRQVDPTGGGELNCGIYHIPYFASSDGRMPIVYVGMPKVELLNEGP